MPSGIPDGTTEEEPIDADGGQTDDMADEPVGPDDGGVTEESEDEADESLCSFPDSDHDGFGSIPCGGTDCDDARAAVYPGAEEICNERDDDCDGLVDEDCPVVCVDGETSPCPNQLGVCQGSLRICAGGHWMDCDYAEYTKSYERSPERSCDGKDNNCDGRTDDIARPCSDNHLGYCGLAGRSETCSAGTWTGCPAASSEICDGIDNDCDGLRDAEDPDLRLHGCELAVGVCAGEFFHLASKCTGGNWLPCAEEYGAGFGAEVCDGADNDCDGATDAQDSDLLEVCNDNIDNDCDGVIDCGPADCEGQLRPCHHGCLQGYRQCSGGNWLACSAPPLTTAEHKCTFGNPDTCCDGLDNDCDGSIDWQDEDCRW